MTERSSNSSAESDEDKRGSTILIVDDEPFNVDLLEQELDLLGYQTVSAVNGQEALDRVAKRAPDLILLDVMMPVMDGFTVCKTLKENEQTRFIPVVIMTALGAVEDRIKGIEAGADDFLTKPVDDRELQARIRTALKQKHAVEEKLHVLGQVSDHLGKFVPESVRRLVEENPTAPDLGKQPRDVSVLFVDIVGYSRLSEKYDADVVNQLVQSYFSAFMDRIHADGGDITETSGDGLMVVFQDPDPLVHTQSAVATALHLLEITESLNQQARPEPLQLHMGLNSDEALVGSTRFEGSSGVRWVFTADGPAVNLAARLATLAVSGQILLTAGAVERLQERYTVESLGQKELKNIAGPVEIFSIKKS
jgi:CheY-like chemotaxis protein/class 3 adenylate cyclase